MTRWASHRALTLPVVGFLLTLLVASGCASCRNGEAEAPTGSPAKEAHAPKPPPVPVGTVEGTVRLAAGHDLPRYTLADLGVREGQPGLAESCPPFGEGDRSPMTLSAARGIEGALVAAADFAASPSAEPARHEVKITDCRLTPRLIVASRGDTLAVTNETKEVFLPVLGRASFAQAVLPAQTQSIPLDRGTHLPLTCAFSLPCGRADVAVLHHPVHTTTGGEGRFRLTNVPAGEKVTIYAWHPLLKEAASSVEVKPGETKRVDLTLERVPVPNEEPTEEPGTKADPADELPTTDRAEDHPEKLF